VLGGLAEFERDLIRARTSDDRERARARGCTEESLRLSAAIGKLTVLGTAPERLIGYRSYPVHKGTHVSCRQTRNASARARR
jgi:hypothetical protein